MVQNKKNSAVINFFLRHLNIFFYPIYFEGYFDLRPGVKTLILRGRCPKEISFILQNDTANM